jgi:hypothetical protein
MQLPGILLRPELRDQVAFWTTIHREEVGCDHRQAGSVHRKIRIAAIRIETGSKRQHGTNTNGKTNMSLDQEQEIAVSQATGSTAALKREVGELRAVNDILAKKVIELEDLVGELNKAREVDLKRLRVSDSLLAKRGMLIKINRIWIPTRFRTSSM